MITQKKVIVVKDEHGEWEGIYLDGDLWTEGHSLRDSDWVELINGHHLESAEIKYVNAIWMEDNGVLPQHYQDIPTEKFV